MSIEITVLEAGGVNCYLVKSGDSHFMIDTGFAGKRRSKWILMSRIGQILWRHF